MKTNMEKQYNIPVLIMAFNRANITQEIFNAVKKVRPKQLFMFVDGPRDTKQGEVELCQAVRDISKQVDWDCELQTLYLEKNAGIHGVNSGPTQALNWFFENVERGIVLEDDCLPDPSFWPFVEEMLNKYQDDERVMHISGNNFQYGVKRGVDNNASYYFSIYPSSWGWATWKRAWKHFDPNLKTFPDFRDKNLIDKMTNEEDVKKVWLETFRKEYYGEWKTWDYEWVYAVWSQGGLSIIPNVNLIKNIGFGEQATFNFSTEHKYANMPTENILPITHPKEIKPNIEADRFVFESTFLYKKPLKRKIKDYILRKLSRQTKNIIKTIVESPKRIKEELFFKQLRGKYATYSMIPHETFKENLRLAKKFKNIKGAVVECGVWRGGMSAALSEVLGQDRKYYLFDSFEGLPPAKEIDGYAASAWQNDKNSKIYFDNCSAEMKYAEEAMQKSGTKNYELKKGWFVDSLKDFKPTSPIAVLRLDGDWYDSTMQCLDGLYKYVVAGGVIIIDDYYTWEGCSKAVHDFLSKHKLSDTVHTSAGGVAYIIKK
jgi:hypothetical protein